MPGKSGQQHYTTPGEKVDTFPEVTNTRNTFWKKEAEKLKGDPGTPYRYPGATASNGASLKKHDWHIEYVVAEGDLFARYNPDAKEPTPRKAKAQTNGATSDAKPDDKAKAKAGN
jgi:hypothetical protein